MSVFIRFVKWLATRASGLVKKAWANKGKVIEWLNTIPTFEWVYEKLKSL